jgi:hypothetical protein
MYELCMFIRYLVSTTQVLKDTEFGLDKWCECGKLLIYFIYLLFVAVGIQCELGSWFSLLVLLSYEVLETCLGCNAKVFLYYIMLLYTYIPSSWNPLPIKNSAS